MRSRCGVRRRLVSLLVAAGIGSTWPVLAQEQTGTVFGTVASPEASAGGTRVTLTDRRRGSQTTTQADDRGQFRFLFLEPGHYRVTADHPSLGSGTAEDLLLGIGEELTVRLTLGRPDAAPAPASATLSLARSARDVHIGADDIDRSFRTRDVTSLMLWAPGAFPDYRSFFWIDGAPLSEHRFHIDGIETTGLFAGGPSQPLPPEFVEDIQVKSSGYAAEYGGGTGAVASVVTRTGTERFSGEVGTFFSGSALDAAPRPTLRLVPSDITRAEYVTYAKDDYRSSSPFYIIGGPVRSGRAWFFSSYMPRLTTTKRTVTFASTGNRDTFTQRTRRHLSSHNLTAQVINRWRLKVAGTISSAFSDNRLPLVDGSSNPASNFAIDQEQPNYSVSIGSDYSLTPRWTTSARIGVFSRDTRDHGVFQGTRYVFSGTNSGFPEVPVSLQRTNGYSNVPTNFETTRDVEQRQSLQLDTTAFLDWRGRHRIKGGLQLNRIAIDDLLGETGNSIVLRWNQALAGARGTYGYYEVNSNQSIPDRGQLERADAVSNNLTLFVQDSWSPTPRLTVDAGVRAETERIPSFAPDPSIPRTAIQFGFRDRLAPRLGFAWTPTADADTKIYGSWGLFYDLTKLSMPVSSFGASQLTRYYYSLDTFDWPNLDVGGCPPACPGTLLRGPVSFLRPANDPTASIIDPDIKPMRQQEMVVGIERSLGARLIGGVRLLRRHLDRALEDGGQITPQGEVLTIGNPGFGPLSRFSQTGSSTHAAPPARRDYTAVEATLVKRLDRRWSLTGIYKWSRLHGNYSGLVDTDRGVVAPNRTQLFNNPIMLFDQRGEEIDGPLSTDRPHVVKTILTYQAPTGTQVSFWTGVASGPPVIRQAYVAPPYNYPVHYLGRGADGRLPLMPNAELYVVQDVRLGGRAQLRVDLSVFNLFNLKTVLERGRNVNQIGSGIVVDTADFLRGYDVEQLIAQQRILRDPRFGMDSVFADPRSAQVGVHLRF